MDIKLGRKAEDPDAHYDHRASLTPSRFDAVGADLVLVGAGHAHVQVIRRFMMRPLAGVRLSLVVDRPEAVYSGMVPGFVAGDYAAHELEIDAVPLARRAQARVVLAAATRIDPSTRQVELESRPPLPYDVASLDVGSSVRGLDLPGVCEHALATRPIRDFVDRLEEELGLAGSAGARAPRLVLVGGGAAGVELAFTLEARQRAAGRRVDLTLLCDTPDILPGMHRRVVRRARREAARRGVRLRCGVRVSRVEKDAVWLDAERERIACDLAVWATGAAPHALLERSALPRDAAGFARVRPTLQVVGHDDLFAAGDCAALEGFPWVPKAGVYAVRQGPFLDANLRARLTGGRLRLYRPQREFLALLNLGERRALGSRGALAFGGRFVWRLKDRIDRRFMRRFQVLLPDGAPAPHFPSPASMGMEPMPCGGCAAKLGASSLERALARLDPPPDAERVVLGLARPDDVAAWRGPGDAVTLASVDAFRSFSDDPFLVGRVAAVNAASDVFASGGLPRHALALVTVPDEEPARAEETLFQVLAGVRAALDPLGVSLVGGHTTAGEELFVGLSIHGEAGSESDLLTLSGARAGDRLLLSKALGTGVVLAADMQGLARGAWLRQTFASLLRANAHAARVAREHGATACTDVTGFGLAGHLGSLLRASGVSARLQLERLPLLDGAESLLARGVRSSYHEQNARGRGAIAWAAEARGHSRAEILFDPQTSGGLLFSLPAERAADALEALRRAGDVDAAELGEVTPPRPDAASFAVE